jgi:hypothetical protein
MSGPNGGHVRYGSPRTTPPATQVCSRCRIEKPSSAFALRPFCRSGLAHTCRACAAVQAKAYRARRHAVGTHADDTHNNSSVDRRASA